MAIKYIAIDSSQAARWYDSIDSIISEPRFLNMDTGIAEVTLQVSTAFRDQMGNHLAGDTLRQWESDNVLSISFLNGDFSVGYWDWEYCKLYFKPEFSNMIKAKSAESKLITE